MLNSNQEDRIKLSFQDFPYINFHYYPLSNQTLAYQLNSNMINSNDSHVYQQYQTLSSILPPSPTSNTQLIRFEISLEAPTAAAQKFDEPPLTYLNKGQYYNITLKDNEQFDGDIISTISITFHDENHRLSAADYWRFWLTQQKDIEEAKAVELDLAKCNNTQMIQSNQFDRISFKWNGKVGASVNLRFNCLSTDFSRIKGVKGIPLRLQIESQSQQIVEKTFCRIKLFRDKGAERKNKDDAKHIERQLEKLRGKNGESHPFWLAYSPTTPVTLFTESVSPNEQDSQYQLYELLLQDQKNVHLPPPASSSVMKRSISQVSLNDSTLPLGIDPTYIPQRRRRIAKLSILVKFHTCDIYRAIYLEHLTVQELVDKISQRMEFVKPIAHVYRKIQNNEKSFIVKVDDEVIQDMPEQQDIQIETEDNLDDTINLILIF